MALTDVAIRKAAPAERPYRMTDSGGLYLWITPAGSKLWRLRYEVSGKEKILSIGPYPEITLSAARTERDEAKKSKRNGRDPIIEQRKRRLSGSAGSGGVTFEVVAREWHEQNRFRWTARHAADVLDSLSSAFEDFGRIPVAEITPPMVLTVLRRIETRPAVETARRVRQRMSAVFVHAISGGLAMNDPAATVRPALAPLIKGRQPAIVDLEEARAMLRASEACTAHPTTKLAHRFLALTALRPGEVLAMPWSEVASLDDAEPVLAIPAPRMKMKRDHLVPLAPAALDVLKAVRTVSGYGPVVFPNSRWAHKPMSENAIGYMLHRAGYHGQHVPHGWRSTFSTIMNERHRADRAVIDLMLAHVSKDKTEAAYNRAAHMARRRELAEDWAALLLEGMAPASELLLGRRR